MSEENLSKRQHTVNSGQDNPLRTTAGDAVSELVVHVFRLNALLNEAGDEMAEPAGQTEARWRVLAAIEHGPLTVPQVARAWWLSRQSVQRLADVLAEEGIVVYRDNPDHRRSKLLQMTSRGRSALDALQAAQSKWANKLGVEIGENDLRAANVVLDKVIRILSSEEPAA